MAIPFGYAEGLAARVVRVGDAGPVGRDDGITAKSYSPPGAHLLGYGRG